MLIATRRLYAIVSLLLSAVSIQVCASESKNPFETKNCNVPAYPDKSLSLSEEGLVKLQFMTNEEGKVVDAKVIKSSGYRSLDNASLTALKECNFKSISHNSTPGKSWDNISFAWVMQ
ncbi:energy transducer TonB [Undibacterium sp. Jales W-56]|uniref:energy transducer TonB n=1 Tax=Undibacterium sp. Jales W-56 TaxID=2897325 RepID=UPI0021CF4662|nr:energy transducer TonB [Undibacterium sp. Jales W-56]MCU6434898.1 energy transducer TonB [Undibacterium sp. Jales W-56]